MANSQCLVFLIRGQQADSKRKRITSTHKKTSCYTNRLKEDNHGKLSNYGVTQVIATKGSGAPNSIGKDASGTCGTITIDPDANVTQN